MRVFLILFRGERFYTDDVGCLALRLLEIPDYRKGCKERLPRGGRGAHQRFFAIKESIRNCLCLHGVQIVIADPFQHIFKVEIGHMASGRPLIEKIVKWGSGSEGLGNLVHVTLEKYIPHPFCIALSAASNYTE